MARTGTRLRLASNSPLIRCRLPGPQLPAQTARSPVSAASAAAANPAASSCRTCSQAISPSRRIASVNPFSESPGIPYTRCTPDAFSVATITLATVVAIRVSPSSSFLKLETIDVDDGPGEGPGSLLTLLGRCPTPPGITVTPGSGSPHP